MGKVQIKMPEEFLLKVSRLADQTDVIIPKVLEAGGEVVLSKVKSNLSSVVGSNTKNRNGNWDVKIGFAEPRSDGNSNAKIANILEYGKSGQPPKPFLNPARTQSKSACIETMKSKLQEEVDRI